MPAGICPTRESEQERIGGENRTSLLRPPLLLVLPPLLLLLLTWRNPVAKTAWRGRSEQPLPHPSCLRWPVRHRLLLLLLRPLRLLLRPLRRLLRPLLVLLLPCRPWSTLPAPFLLLPPPLALPGRQWMTWAGGGCGRCRNRRTFR